MPNPKPSDSPSKPKPFVFSWQRFFLHVSIVSVCLLLGLLSWSISKPQSIRLYETPVGQHLAVNVTTGVTIALDENSSIAVTDFKPLRMEIFKGNVYFEIEKDAVYKPSVKVGNVTFEEVATRFSLRAHKTGGGVVSVAAGQISVHLPSGVYLISALEQADFDDFSISKHRLISEYDVAPWVVYE